MPLLMLNTQVIWWLGLLIKLVSTAVTHADVAHPKTEIKHFWLRIIIPTRKRQLLVTAIGWIPLWRRLNMYISLVGAPLHSRHEGYRVSGAKELWLEPGSGSARPVLITSLWLMFQCINWADWVLIELWLGPGGNSREAVRETTDATLGVRGIRVHSGSGLRFLQTRLPFLPFLPTPLGTSVKTSCVTLGRCSVWRIG